MKLTGKIAIVTGGSRGIGFAIAKILSENGALVVITSKAVSYTHLTLPTTPYV